jgi:anti-sigma regulatory factor (Ser/Thr protein kinase)
MAPVDSVSVPGTTAGVSTAAAAFDDFCRQEQVPQDARWRFQVVLDEILSNIVRHGYRGREGLIRLTFSREPETVCVNVVDQAPPFDPTTAPVPDTTSPLESRRPGGLGVRFAESLLDGLSYERRGDENHVRLTWRLPGSGAPAGTQDGNH